jgi:hypothetical protein
VEVYRKYPSSIQPVLRLALEVSRARLSLQHALAATLRLWVHQDWIREYAGEEQHQDRERAAFLVFLHRVGLIDDAELKRRAGILPQP